MADDCEDLNKVLAVVIKRRKTIPTKCLEVSKLISSLEIQRLENAKIITEENKEKEEFRKLVQGFKSFSSFHLALDDLHEAEKKVEITCRRIKDVNHYLEKRSKLFS